MNDCIFHIAEIAVPTVAEVDRDFFLSAKRKAGRDQTDPDPIDVTGQFVQAYEPLRKLLPKARGSASAACNFIVVRRSTKVMERMWDIARWSSRAVR